MASRRSAFGSIEPVRDGIAALHGLVDPRQLALPHMEGRAQSPAEAAPASKADTGPAPTRATAQKGAA